MTECKVITIYKGFGTRWNGIDLVSVTFSGDTSFEGFSAEFLIGDIKKTYSNIQEGFAINLTAQETGTLEVGPTTGSLIISDSENHKKPFSTEIPFLVKDWEDGDLSLDGFKMTIDGRVQQNNFAINISGVLKNPEEYDGYDSTKVQELRNIMGHICWIDV